MNIEGTRSVRDAVSIVLLGTLAFGLAACGKDEPPQRVQPAVVQPSTAPETKAGEIRTETPEPAPVPKSDPDAELAGKVKTALHATPGLEALAVDIVAAEGRVTLFGTAVKSVQNKIVVVQGS